MIGRVFDNAGLIELEEELKHKQTEALEQYQHYTEERNEAVAKQAICGRFDYKADDRYQLGKRKTASEKQIQTLQAGIDLLKQEKVNLRAAQQELEQTLKKTTESQQQAQAAVEMFESWLEKETAYQTLSEQTGRSQ
jgi:thymidylate synthase